MAKNPIEKALSQPLTPYALDVSISSSNPSVLGNPPSVHHADILVTCVGCGAVFTKSRIAPDEGPKKDFPHPYAVVGAAVTCPCCLQTRGWREIADVKFRSVDTT